ncbi:hypothetical protein [Modicisalibacter zincidurans]|uniref:Uncharacterized protein n=1 Tax=Modicisalibacter zincidurans TaxID=1178777 RepID=A0ABP9R5M5_9GAMM|nr:hypothetical protein [Halomonas zincidurans]
MSVKTVRRIRPFLVALVVGLGFPALAFAEDPIPQTTDEATQDTDESQQQAARGDEQRKRLEGKVKPQEAQKDQDSSLNHDTDEERLDQESGSDAMMQPDGYNGG